MVLQSKSVNNVCKLFQLRENFVLRLPSGAFAPGPHWGLLFPRPPTLYPQVKISGVATVPKTILARQGPLVFSPSYAPAPTATNFRYTAF